MRRKSRLLPPGPLVPTSVYFSLVTVIMVMASLAGLLSATKERPRTRVYLPKEWRTDRAVQSQSIAEARSPQQAVEASLAGNGRVTKYYATLD